MCEKRPIVNESLWSKHMQTSSPTTDAVLIRTRQLRDRYGGVSATWVDRKLASDPEFPKPKYISGRRFFSVSELEEYEHGLARSPAA